MLRLVICAMVIATSCGPAVPPVPSKGGPAWHELTSEHFIVWTDASESTARELVARMEDLRQAVIGIGFRGVAGKGRALVIALRDDNEVAAFLPPGDFVAVASWGGVVRQPMILLSANPTRDPKGEIAAHELTHTISRAAIRKQPRWFSEGLAKFFETIEIDRKRGTIDLGRAPTYRGEPLRMKRMIPLAKLFACSTMECTDGSFYVTAWALFTYAFNRYPRELAQFEDLLAAGTPSETAWQTAFGAIPLETLESEMRQWIAHGSHTVMHFKAKLQSWPVTVSPLGDADVYTARALLRLQYQPDRRAEGRKLLDEAIAIDPTHPMARMLEYELTQKADPEIAKRITEAHPDDWRGWFLLAMSTKDREAYERACGLAAANPLIELGCPSVASPPATSQSPGPS